MDCYQEGLMISIRTCEGLYAATRCRGVSWVDLRAWMVLAPFLTRKEAENASPRRIARCRRLFPSESTLSRSHLWLTRVLAMPSWR